MAPAQLELEKEAVASHFFAHRDRIEREIAGSIASLGEKNKLRDACEYAMVGGGKRFRPLIVLMLAEALGNDLDVIEAALCVEFFHTASLIADDLPCMDNDDERRDKPSLHKVYGETIALLASYALIAAAFEKIYNSAEVMRRKGSPYAERSDQVCTLALKYASICSGITGAAGGQFLDLYPPTLTLETMKKLIYQKTVTLFEVSFLFGWLFGGGEIDRIEEVRHAAYHFGMAFQIADDIDDMLQDEKNQRELNIARLLGKTRAFSLFQEEMKKLEEILRALQLFTPSFEKMCTLLTKRATSAL